MQEGSVEDQSIELGEDQNVQESKKDDKTMDEFDKGFKTLSKSGIKVNETNKNGKLIEHTFFGDNDKTGLNMLVSEQK